MSLTPLDIHNKEFRTVLRGYDRNEVDEFLDLIIKDLEQVFKESAELKDANHALREKLEHYHNLEQTLHNALVVAQETAEEVKASAKREAQLIIREAEMKAERLVDEAIGKERRMTAELDEMRKQAGVFRARLINLLKAQLEMLDGDDWEQLETAATSSMN
ncbi:MAG TPA: DivIVA domain-containing protein [Firmicutes bacterium]|nr:DivIVA domain-containing protein [Bacillota bacterium]